MSIPAGCILQRNLVYWQQTIGRLGNVLFILRSTSTNDTYRLHLVQPRYLVFTVYDVWFVCCHFKTCFYMIMSPLDESAPRFPSSWDSVWRRLSDEGWTRWESTECLASRLTSRRWRLHSIQVSTVQIRFLITIDLTAGKEETLYMCSLVLSDCCFTCPADNKDVSVMMREMDVNAIAGTLKLYFRELPEPLFTDELYPNFAGGIGQSPPLYFCIISSGQVVTNAVASCDTGTWMCPFFALQLSLTAWPRRAACSTCCCLCQSPTWWPSCSCSTTLKGKRPHK